MSKIKWQDLTQGREITNASEFTDSISENLLHLAEKLNTLQNAYGKPLTINSGWRPYSVNAAVGGAPNSGHMRGECADISDADCHFWRFILNNIALCEQLDIYLEDKRWTPTWVHIGIKPPKSGKRIFIPNSQPPKAPDLWDGKI